MEKNTLVSQPLSVLSQSEKNTTLWIGHLPADSNDHIGGQTFTCPSDGLLENIQLYVSAVQQPGSVTLSLHEFEDAGKHWGPSLSEAVLDLQKGDAEKWRTFVFNRPLRMKQGVTYGFRLHTSNGMIGLGEAACQNNRPFTFGKEWTADSRDPKEHYFSYFSLCFKIDLAA